MSSLLDGTEVTVAFRDDLGALLGAASYRVDGATPTLLTSTGTTVVTYTRAG